MSDKEARICPVSQFRQGSYEDEAAQPKCCAIRFQSLRLILASALLFSSVIFPLQSETHTVTVNADGTFDPAWTWIHDGDTVEWVFHERTDTIIPVSPAAGILTAYKPYQPSDPNEFTGPMPRAASGIFTLGPDGPAWVIKNIATGDVVYQQGIAILEYDLARTKDPYTGDYLWKDGEEYASMDWTWQQPNITGVFIRMRWNEVHLGPDDFDWTAMDREIEKAVQHGKLYSLAFKAGHHGTPDWIFDPSQTASVVERLQFQDGGSKLEPGKCGTTMFLGSPADLNYRQHYFDLLGAAAEHIRKKNAWYRALAYVKPSGANLFTHENRLPKRCQAEAGCICNPQVWAEEGGYSSTALYEFYSEQTALLTEAFPNKDMSYMLIQAGFPLVNDAGEYLGQPDPPQFPLPHGTEQTEFILEQGRIEHGIGFAVQHNGLGPNGSPNQWVLDEGLRGQVTGFQTSNAGKVDNPETLEATMQNAWDNSEAIFLEIYEERFWEAEIFGLPSGDTVGDWAERFHEWRRTHLIDLPAPLPLMHSHTFTRTIHSSTDTQFLYYIHGSKYGTEPIQNFGVIAILPEGSP